MRYIYKDKVIVLAALRRRLVHMGQDVSLPHLSRVFSGERKPSWELATGIAKVLGISLDELETLLRKTSKEAEKWRNAARIEEPEDLTAEAEGSVLR